MSHLATSVRLRAVAALLLAALAGACASSNVGQSTATAATPEDQAKIEDARRSLGLLEQQLDADRAAATPDCKHACELAASICELATRICGIASRYPATDPIDGRCADAHHRCQRAAGLTNARCGCDKAR